MGYDGNWIATYYSRHSWKEESEDSYLTQQKALQAAQQN